MKKKADRHWLTLWSFETQFFCQSSCDVFLFFMCIYVDFFLDLISSYLRAECEAGLFFMLLPFFFNCCNVLSTFYFYLLSFSCKQSTWWYVNIYVSCISTLLIFVVFVCFLGITYVSAVVIITEWCHRHLLLSRFVYLNLPLLHLSSVSPNWNYRCTSIQPGRVV